MRKYNGLEKGHGALWLAALLLAGCAASGPRPAENTPAPPAATVAPADAPVLQARALVDAEPAVVGAGPSTPQVPVKRPPATPSAAVSPSADPYADAASIPLPPAAPAPATAAPGPEAATSSVAMRSDAPLRYVVKKGDTLWGIASRYIADPWQWPEIWYVNNQLADPHRIYPGDVLTLVWRNGKPIVAAAEGIDANLEYLSPRVRESALETRSSIPTIPLEAIRDFLKSPRLVETDALRDAPYLLSFVDPHVVEGAGSLVYIQKLPSAALPRYDAIRVGRKYVDPDSGEVLGWEGTPVGSIAIRKPGAPATGLITSSAREAKAGDRLIKPLDDEITTDFFPHAPAQQVNARILSVYDGVSHIGQYQVVTLNRGEREGIEPGHVLSILQVNRTAIDPQTQRKVQLPPLYAGTLMVFKVETRVSYALVMTATREIHVLDRAEKPQPGERL